jgi:hypothetical protein
MVDSSVWPRRLDFFASADSFWVRLVGSAADDADLRLGRRLTFPISSDAFRPRSGKAAISILRLSPEESWLRILAARRSRSSAARNLASQTQSAPARSALTRCQAASFSNSWIVSKGFSDIDKTSGSERVRSLTELLGRSAMNITHIQMTDLVQGLPLIL